MILGRIIEVADELEHRITDTTHRFYLGIADRGNEVALDQIMSEMDRLDVLRMKVAWYKARFVVEAWDATLVEADELLAGLQRRRELFYSIIRRFDGEEGPDFVAGLDEAACRVSLAALDAEIVELREAIDDTRWASEVIDTEVDEILGVDVEIRMSTRDGALPVASVPSIPKVEATPKPRKVTVEEIIADEDYDTSITDIDCPLCMSEDRNAIEQFAASADGDIMATLDFATRVCDDRSLTPKDVVMHLDDHAPKSVRQARRGPS